MSEQPSVPFLDPAADERGLRELAVKRLKDKRELKAHVLAYVAVNLFLTMIWFVSGQGLYWPVFVIFGWGIGLAFHVWDVASPEATPQQVAAEMDRLRRRNA